MAALRIKTLLVSLNVALLIAMAVIGASFYASVSHLEHEVSYIGENSVPSLLVLNKAEQEVALISTTMGLHVLAPTPEATQAIDVGVTREVEKIDARLDAYRGLISDSQDQALFNAATEKWSIYKAKLAKVRALSLEVRTFEATEALRDLTGPVQSALNEALDASIAYNEKLVDKGLKDASAVGNIATVAAIVLALFGIALAGFAIWAAGSRILRPLAALNEGLKRMAAGELDLAIPGADKADEIGEVARSVDEIKVNAAAKAAEEGKIQARVTSALGQGLQELSQGRLNYRIHDRFPAGYEQLRTDFNQAMNGLAEVIGEVLRGSGTVQSASAEMNAASSDLGRRTEQQAAALEETTAALAQMTDAVRQTAEYARDVSAAVRATDREAGASAAVVSDAIGAMRSLEGSSSEIAQITSVIDSIAFQTNLLALNAGVEAARAGEAGRGFAVVADEVRSLALRSADAARDISKLIQQSVGQVADGVRLVDRTGEALKTITDKIGEINVRIGEIAGSAEAQSANLEQVSAAARDLDRTTQQNAALVEETSAAARTLSNEAELLAQLVGRFEIDSAYGSSSHMEYRAA